LDGVVQNIQHALATIDTTQVQKKKKKKKKKKKNA
jgi:hypothetical protein